MLTLFLSSSSAYHSRIAAKRKATRRHLPVVVEQDEDGVFIMSVPTLVGCRSYGKTIDEAMANIEEAAALCIDEDKASSPRA